MSLPEMDEFASSSRLIPMLPLPAPAKLPLHDSESFSETPQGQPGSVFKLPQIPVVHSKKCPNYSSPPQIRDEVLLFNVSSMNYEFTLGFSKFQGKRPFFCLRMRHTRVAFLGMAYYVWLLPQLHFTFPSAVGASSAFLRRKP
jgi:hypothetical protein